MSPTYRYPRPSVTVDVVLFAVRDARLELLLIQRGNEPFAGRWALPGGFLDMDEELEAAARRELLEETAVRAGALEELGAYGTVGRDPRGRTISVAYLALVCGAPPVAIAGDDASSARWVRADRLPLMAFDHRRIVKDALRRLDRMIFDLDADLVRLLPRRFTASELRALCTAGRSGDAGRRDPVRSLRSRDLIERCDGAEPSYRPCKRRRTP